MNYRKLLNLNHLIIGSCYTFLIMLYFYNKSTVDILIKKFPELLSINISQLFLPITLIVLFFSSALILKKITSISILVISILTLTAVIYFLMNYTLFVDLSCGCAILITLTTLKIITVILSLMLVLIVTQFYLKWKLN